MSDDASEGTVGAGSGDGGIVDKGRGVAGGSVVGVGSSGVGVAGTVGAGGGEVGVEAGVSTAGSACPQATTANATSSRIRIKLNLWFMVILLTNDQRRRMNDEPFGRLRAGRWSVVIGHSSLS